MENSFLRDAIDRITELARPSVMKVDDIAYLFENNLLAKAKELLKDVKAMTPFI